MTAEDRAVAERRMEHLAAELSRHARLYFADDRPELSDAEYDRLVRELTALEGRWPDLVRADSPTHRIGAPPAEGFTPAPHRVPMLSLDNAMDEAELRAFDERVRRVLGSAEPVAYAGEPKLDGAGVELVYEAGRLRVGATRGDGRVGEDVTSNLRLVWSLPLTLGAGGPTPPPLVSVRGEVILPLAAFERLNRERVARGDEPFANPRNAAAGSLRQLHEIDTRRLGALELRAYALGEGVPPGVQTQMDVLATLRAWGFVVSAESELCPDVDAAVAYHGRMLARRADLPIESDGTVFKVNRLDLQREVGELPRSPRWAIATKFPPQQETTVVEAIEVNVGRTGALTPVAKLRPVHVGGVTVSSASLHNQDEVDRKDVRVGDTVLIQRAGDVIPQIVLTIPEKRPPGTQPFRLPAECPVCGGPAVRLEGEAVTRCTNLDCPAQLKNNLLHLASRSALDIDGLGEKLVDQLVDRGLVRRVSDVFAQDAATLAALDRMGEKSATNLVASLARARKTTLPRFLLALGIGHVGENVAQLLARHFGDLDPLIAATPEEIDAVPGIGSTIAESVSRFFADPRNAAEVTRLRELGVAWVRAAVTPRRDGPLTGKSFVLTGTLHGTTREDAKRRIEEAGGRVTSSVSKQTDYVVAGADPGSKLAKAQELELTVVDEAGLEALLAGPPAS